MKPPHHQPTHPVSIDARPSEFDPESFSPPIDGPCHPYTWRRNGQCIADTLQPAAWKLVNHLWQLCDRAATFADLLIPVYEDREHEADHNAFGSLRRAANRFFAKHGLPWRVHVKKTVVYLRLSTNISSQSAKCSRSDHVVPEELPTT